MADAPGQPPVVAESLQTRTPMDPCAGTLVLTQEHDEELRQWWQNQPPLAPARSVHHTAPHAHRPASGAQGRARRAQRNTMDRGNDPPQFTRASQNIAAAVMLLCGLSELNNPHKQVTHQNLWALVETATVQQAKSSASRH